MRIVIALLVSSVFLANSEVAAVRPAPTAPGLTDTTWLDPYRVAAARLIGQAFATRDAWDRLAELTDTFGPRLSGSAALDAAIAWAQDRLRADEFDAVRLEPVMVPHWVRGTESLSVVRPVPRPLVMLGLGGSVATPPAGLEAEALIVGDFADLEARGASARGRIVVYNTPFTSYEETVRYRSDGASRAAQLGAVAALVRSVGPIGLRTPHTGALSYASDQPKIPAAAITAEDAEALARMQGRGERIVLRLSMTARFEQDVASANVVAELRGREYPDEFVVIGGHLDSWDVGTGASDDGVGCIVAWEAVRLMKTLDLRPRRTVRLVLFANEENGLRGGLAYRDRHRETLARHVLMVETDLGVFPPISLGVSGNDAARTRLAGIATLLRGIGVDRLDPQGGGADIGPSVRAAGIPAASVRGNVERYFVIHHTPADTIDRIDPQDVSRAVAAMAVLSYVAAEMPTRFDAPE